MMFIPTIYIQIDRQIDKMKGGDLNVVISIEYDDNQLVRRIKKDFRFNVLKSKKKTILKQINQTNKQRKKKKFMNNNKKEKKKN